MAYEYDHVCPFEAFITNLGKYNEGELVGEWVKFPTTSEELQKVFERIGIGSKDDFGNPYKEWFISDYDCYVVVPDDAGNKIELSQKAYKSLRGVRKRPVDIVVGYESSFDERAKKNTLEKVVKQEGVLLYEK